MPIAEEAVVAHAMEAGREHVQEYAPDEFPRGEPHRFLLAVPVIPVAEADLPGAGLEQPVVGDGDASCYSPPYLR